MAMKMLCLFALLMTAHEVRADSTEDATGNPIAKIIDLITQFQGKIIRDGEVEQKAYEEYFEWCDDASKEKGFESETLTSKVEKLSSVIEEATADIEDAATKIEELSGATSTDEADLKAATIIRERDHKDFSAEEAELMKDIDMLGRAISVLEKELKGSSFLQSKEVQANVKNVLSTLSTMVDAMSFASHDKQRLQALLQTSQGDDDSFGFAQREALLGAPDPAAYESKSGGIVDMMADMKEKAETQLSEARKEEMKGKMNFEMLKMSLKEKIGAQKGEMDDTKKAKAQALEVKAVAEGEAEIANKALSAAQEELHTIQMDCMEKASDHEITVAGRTAELKALAKTKKIIQAATSFQQVSFIQLSSHSRTLTKAGQTGVRVANIIRKLAKTQHSAALNQLASRVEATVRFMNRYGNKGDDPFKKVKGLIDDMIAKLMKEAQEEAEMKGYCDAEMAKTEKKKDDLSDDLEDTTAKIDDSTSASTRLKEEVKNLQKELLELAKSQEEMDKARKDAHAAFLESSGDLQKGLDGLRKALDVLREYYAKDDSFVQVANDDADDAESEKSFDAMMQVPQEGAFAQQPKAPEKHKKSSGAGDAIIGMLEVAESDFAKNLAEETQEEDAAQVEYDTLTQENKVVKAEKEQDVKYKTKEYTALDKMVTELTTDRDGMNAELDAVLQYYDKLKEKCVAKPEPYEERKKRREAEIKGLQEALSILEGEAVFIQRHSNAESDDDDDSN